MKCSTVLMVFVLICAMIVEGQRRPEPPGYRRPVFERQLNRPTGSNRRNGPMPPPTRQQIGRRIHGPIHPPGFKPPSGIAKKLNDAVDFRALARVLLKH